MRAPAGKRHSVKVNGRRWPKQYLLPMPHDVVRSLSLTSHLALEASRTEGGNRHTLNELTRLTYLSFFMWEKGVGRGSVDVFLAAEHQLNLAVEVAEKSDVWHLGIEAVKALEHVLSTYDEQIATASARVYLESVEQLTHLLAKHVPISPLQRRAAA